MLLQLPEQKLHCHLVMALDSHSPHSHRAGCQQDHVQSEVREHCVPKLLCFRFSDTPSSLVKFTEQIWVTPYRCIGGCSGMGGGGSEAGCQVMRTVHVWAPHFSLLQCYPFVLEWLTSRWITKSRQSLGGSWRVIMWSGSYVNHQQRLARGPLISLLLQTPALYSLRWGYTLKLGA